MINTPYNVIVSLLRYAVRVDKPLRGNTVEDAKAGLHRREI